MVDMKNGLLFFTHAFNFIKVVLTSRCHKIKKRYNNSKKTKQQKKKKQRIAKLIPKAMKNEIHGPKTKGILSLSPP